MMSSSYIRDRVDMERVSTVRPVYKGNCPLCGDNFGRLKLDVWNRHWFCECCERGGTIEEFAAIWRELCCDN